MLFRFLLVSFCLAVIACFNPANGFSENPKRVIIFETMPVPVIQIGSEVFRETMSELGYQPGVDIEFTILKAEGDAEKGHRMLAKALAEQRPDLVISIATMAAVITHKQLKDTDIPWLFFTVADPVGAGIVEAEDQPTGRNVSGRIYGVDPTVRLNMVLRLLQQNSLPSPLRIGFIHTDYPSSLSDLNGLKRTFDASSEVVLVPYQLTYQPVPENLGSMLGKVRSAGHDLAEKVDFWWSPIGPLGERIEYTRLLIEETGKPVVIGTNLLCVEAGALLYVGPSVPGQAREMAVLADQVLQGKPVGEIAVTRPDIFDLGLNLQTAEAMGLVVPSDILSLAGDNLFR